VQWQGLGWARRARAGLRRAPHRDGGPSRAGTPRRGPRHHAPWAPRRGRASVEPGQGPRTGQGSVPSRRAPGAGQTAAAPGERAGRMCQGSHSRARAGRALQRAGREAAPRHVQGVGLGAPSESVRAEAAGGLSAARRAGLRHAPRAGDARGHALKTPRKGRRKEDGGFTSTTAGEVPRELRSAIRFLPARCRAREKLWVEQGRERRLFFLGFWRRGRGCRDGWCAREVGDAGARCSVGPARRGQGRAGPRQELAGPRQGRGPWWATRAGASAGTRGRQAAHDERERRRGGRESGWAAAEKPSRERGGGVWGFSYFLFSSTLS
jgi:hypothetical protein